MKRYFLALCLMMVGSVSAQAFLLEEQVLETQNKHCKIMYLTEKNVKGWFIRADREECGPDGMLTGYHHVTVVNAFARPVEHLYGYFSQGYWTGDDFIRDVELTRYSKELGIQKATFPVETDADIQVRYIAQMSSHKNNAGAYPPFKVCAPFRLLGISQDTLQFENPHVLQRIFRTAERIARYYCPTEKEILLYLSSSENPAPEEVSLFVKMNLTTHRHQIIRPKADQPGAGEFARPLTQTPPPSESNAANEVSEMPDDTPEELIETIVSDEPETQTTAATESVRIEPKQTKTPPYFDRSDRSLSFDRRQEGDATTRRSYLKPLQKVTWANVSQEFLSKGLVDLSEQARPVSHLLLTAEVMQAPVFGKTALKIESFHIDGTARVSAPVTLDAEGRYVAPGWYLVKGQFVPYQAPRQDGPVGLVRMLDIQACQTPFCQDQKE